MKGRSTLPPLFGAVQAFTTHKNKAAPKFYLSSVGFFADRHDLRKLIAWANNKYDHWRTNTQLEGEKTDLADCWSPVTDHTRRWSDPYGFKKACTHPTPVCENRTSHRHILTRVRLANIYWRPGRVCSLRGTLVVSRWSSVSRSMPVSLSVLPGYITNQTTPDTTPNGQDPQLQTCQRSTNPR